MTKFDNPIDAFEELEFIVRETRLTHRLLKDKKGKYFVSGGGYNPKGSTIMVAEMNCRVVS